MKLLSKRELVVLTYLMEKKSRPIENIQAELEISDDDGFQFEETLHDLVKEGSIVPISNENIVDGGNTPQWEITDFGKVRLNDLELDKYEEENKMPYIIRAIVIVIAILAFMMIFPRMFRR
jgi:hypothetical protein